MNLIKKVRSKLRRESRGLYRDALHTLGLDSAFYRQARGSRLLVYHGICLSDHTRYSPIFLTQQTFEAHLRYYQEYFNVVTLDAFYAGDFSSSKLNVCLTFDDGFANNHQYVLPLLERYQLPVAFFITGIRTAGYDILWNDFLNIFGKYGPQQLTWGGMAYHKGQYNKYYAADTGKTLNDTLRATGFEAKAAAMQQLRPLAAIDWAAEKDYWQTMTDEQIKAMAASPYVTIGSHGQYHNDLARIPVADSTAEMQVSKSYLENLIQQPVHSIAFPYGSYTPAVVAAAKQAGYRQLLATDFVNAADVEDAAMRERLTVNPFISVNNQMHAIIKGRYDE